MAYFANGTEGDYLESQCERCPLGHRPCPVKNVQLSYNYAQNRNADLASAMNLLINEKGDCQLRPLLPALEETPLFEE